METEDANLQCPEYPLAAFLVSIRSFTHNLVALLHLLQQLVRCCLCDLMRK
jgi:hypothetical protein